MADQSHYRFEPLEARGLLLGFGAGQLAVVAISLVAAVVIFTTWPGGLGLAGSAGVACVAALLCRPVRGLAPARWAAVGTGYAGRRRRSVFPPPPQSWPIADRSGQAGPRSAQAPAERPMRTFVRGAYVWEQAPEAGDGPLGIVVDGPSGTISALIRVRGGDFCLLDGADQSRQLAAWAGVLESLSGLGSGVARLQWCQQAVRADSSTIVDHLLGVGDRSAPGFADHLALVESATYRAWWHDTLLVLAVHGRSRRGRPDPAATAVLRNEVRALRSQLRDAGLVCEGVLDRPGVSRALSAAVSGSRKPAADPGRLAFEEHWSAVRADGLWHRTYWVAEWPRSRVGPDFLSPMLMGQGRRCFAVTMAPVPAAKAVKDAESSRTAQIADAHLRAQGGFLETALHRRHAEALEGREAELADGRALFNLSAYITVSAPDKPGLEQASAEMERSAAASRIYVRVLYGQQFHALTWALPMARGLG